MTRFNLVLAIVFLGGASTFSHYAAAQGTYTPQTPALSPWMGLWNQNTGALDNYHTFVRPQMELNRAMQMQDLALSRQAAGLQTLTSEMGQSRGPQTGMMPTGQGATFMTYSHFYSNNQTPQALAPRLGTQRRAVALPTAASARTNGADFTSPGFNTPGFQLPGAQR